MIYYELFATYYILYNVYIIYYILILFIIYYIFYILYFISYIIIFHNIILYITIHIYYMLHVTYHICHVCSSPDIQRAPFFWDRRRCGLRSAAGKRTSTKTACGRICADPSPQFHILVPSPEAGQRPLEKTRNNITSNKRKITNQTASTAGNYASARNW